MVHPTLRVKAIELGKMLRKELQIPIYLDEDDLEGLDTKRGTNDIVEK
jgi:glutamate formiminotransferase